MINEVIDNMFKFDVEFNPDGSEERHLALTHIYKNGPKFNLGSGKCIRLINCIVELDENGNLDTFRATAFADGFFEDEGSKVDRVILGEYKNTKWKYDSFRDIYSEWPKERRAQMRAIEKVKARTKRPLIETIRFLAKFVIERHVALPDRSGDEARARERREQERRDKRMEQLRAELERMRRTIGTSFDEGRMLLKMLVNEAINRYLFENTRRSVLNEGIKSDYLKRMVRRNDGIREINKELMLDKNDYPNYWYFGNDNQIPYKLRKFVIPVISFNSGAEVVIENPKYTDNPDVAQQVQDMLSQYGELIDARLADYPGHTYEKDEYDRDDDGTTRWYKETHHVSPNDERLNAHKKARGVKTRGLHNKSDRDYRGYVGDYVRRLADKYGMQTLYDFEGNEYFYYPCDWDSPERSEIEAAFRKYGYGNHEHHGPLTDENNNDIEVYMSDLVIGPGENAWFEGGRNPYTGNIDFNVVRNNIDAPRIGTSDFFGR